jgi:deoxyribonuclease V
LKGNIPPALEEHLFEVQRRIAARVILEDHYSAEAAAGVDQAFLGELVISGAVVLDRNLKVSGRASYAMKAAIPYISGLLSFREGAPALKAVRALVPKPTLLFIDGCGINHPRMAGLASYIGVILNLPTIAVSKEVLCGSFNLPEKVGEAKPLIYQERQVGYLLKSKKGCKPIVVAPGHMVSFESSLELTCSYIKNHKLPEPCRLAHEYARMLKVRYSPVQAASL